VATELSAEFEQSVDLGEVSGGLGFLTDEAKEAAAKVKKFLAELPVLLAEVIGTGLPAWCGIISILRLRGRLPRSCLGTADFRRSFHTRLPFFGWLLAISNHCFQGSQNVV
jgi:hypothetical protein